MRIDSNKFYSVELEVDILRRGHFAMKFTGLIAPHLTGLALAGITSGSNCSSRRPAPPSWARHLTGPTRSRTRTPERSMASRRTGNFNITY